MLSKSQEDVLLKFMERAIENINTCLAGQYTLSKILIEKGLVTEAELLSKIKDDKNLPVRKKGSEILQQMLVPDWGKLVDLDTKDPPGIPIGGCSDKQESSSEHGSNLFKGLYGSKS